MNKPTSWVHQHRAGLVLVTMTVVSWSLLLWRIVHR